jgi:hypothetical protein
MSRKNTASPGNLYPKIQIVVVAAQNDEYFTGAVVL